MGFCNPANLKCCNRWAMRYKSHRLLIPLLLKMTATTAITDIKLIVRKIETPTKDPSRALSVINGCARESLATILSHSLLIVGEILQLSIITISSCGHL